MYQVSFEYIEQFLSYGPRLKFLHDDEDYDDDAKAMTITRLFFSNNRRAKNKICNFQFEFGLRLETVQNYGRRIRGCSAGDLYARHSLNRAST